MLPHSDMQDHGSPQWIAEQADYSLKRILERIQRQDEKPPNAASFHARLRAEWPGLFTLLHRLYGTHYDFYYHLQEMVEAMLESWNERNAELRDLDTLRLARPEWYQSEQMLGAAAYVDLFAGDLAGLRQRIPYLKEWGVTYLHLMPLFAAPPGDNDGGYAVSDYRTVDPKHGTIEQLREIAGDLRESGISLVLDFVFNHTSDEHSWAMRAKGGDEHCLEYYLTFTDRTVPDAYERTMREIFPTVRRGSFTWNNELQRWVWTTFHSYQWDLNYANPEVFRAMAGEMLFLANAGVEVLRLDAVAFIWKRMGTDCENQPEAHWIIQAMNSVARIAAPALLFKSEAIVHPDEVVKYVGVHECQLSYNPLLMALLWESLATRQVKLLRHSMQTRFALPEGTAWVNYIRCHDDIGWTFDDADAAAVGIDGSGHRRFLNDFYQGRFPHSFSRGIPFQENPQTGDARVCGMLASLAGLERAQDQDRSLPEEQRSLEVDHSVKRILLLYGVILSTGGIPLIYLNDETATFNDYSFRDEPAKADDSRWVHRVRTDWKRVKAVTELASETAQTAVQQTANGISAHVYSGLRKLINIRRKLPALAGSQVRVLDAGNMHVLVFKREGNAHDDDVVVYANFSESAQSACFVFDNSPLCHVRDLISGEETVYGQPVQLGAYAVKWMTASSNH